MSFNPFGAGRCLSTHHYHAHKTQYVSIPLEQGGVFRRSPLLCNDESLRVSIPLEQGGVFRPGTELLNTIIERSQSL